MRQRGRGFSSSAKKIKGILMKYPGKYDTMEAKKEVIPCRALLPITF